MATSSTALLLEPVATLWHGLELPQAAEVSTVAHSQAPSPTVKRRTLPLATPTAPHLLAIQATCWKAAPAGSALPTRPGQAQHRAAKASRAQGLQQLPTARHRSRATATSRRPSATAAPLATSWWARLPRPATPRPWRGRTVPRRASLWHAPAWTPRPTVKSASRSTGSIRRWLATAVMLATSGWQAA